MRFYTLVQLWRQIPLPDSATEVMSLRADDGFELFRSRDGQALVIRKSTWEADIPWEAVRIGYVDVRRSDPELESGALLDEFVPVTPRTASPFAKATEILKPTADQKFGGSFTKDVKAKR